MPTLDPPGGQEPWKTDFHKHTIDLAEVVSGGPLGEADRWLEDREPVAVVRLGGEAKAYPIRILMWMPAGLPESRLSIGANARDSHEGG